MDWQKQGKILCFIDDACWSITSADFAHVRHPLDIWKHNLQAEMGKVDCKSIAGIKQNSIVFATTTCSGVRNPKILETIIDFVTVS